MNGTLLGYGCKMDKWTDYCVVWGAICGLYDGIGAAGARVYSGRFTLVKSDFSVIKPLSDEHAPHLQN